MVELKARNVGELIGAVKAISSGWRESITDPQELWFRGQPKRSFPLLPGLYRPQNVQYHFHEPSLLGHFRTLAAPHTPIRPADEWEWSFLAQHYGLPTRLLDWTQSVVAAAYFAVCEAVLCRDRLSVDEDLRVGTKEPIFDDASPTVWLIDAGTLNRHACGADIVLYPGGPRTKKYLPDAIEAAKVPENEHPVAILAPRANVRIVAQQGTFTVHGHSASLSSNSPPTVRALPFRWVASFSIEPTWRSSGMSFSLLALAGSRFFRIWTASPLM